MRLDLLRDAPPRNRHSSLAALHTAVVANDTFLLSPLPNSNRTSSVFRGPQMFDSCSSVHSCIVLSYVNTKTMAGGNWPRCVPRRQNQRVFEEEKRKVPQNESLCLVQLQGCASVSTATRTLICRMNMDNEAWSSPNARCESCLIARTSWRTCKTTASRELDQHHTTAKRALAAQRTAAMMTAGPLLGAPAASLPRRSIAS